MLHDLPQLREIISSHGLSADKKFGQNFLLDLNLTRKIVRQATDLKNKTIIEIGPGPGGLTRALLESEAEHVIAIEFDPRCIEALQSLKEAASGRLTLIHGNALSTDIASLPGKQKAIIANLPYNIATPLLIGWLKNIWQAPDSISEMLLMFQKEVAERITASAGTKAYGRLAILSQWLTHSSIAVTLPPSAFTPPPKIYSAVVKFTPKNPTQRLNPDFEKVETLTAAAFGQRRKMIRQSLKAYTEHFEKIDLNPENRAETLSVDDYLKLGNLL